MSDTTPAKVLGIHQRAGYRPDLAALARNQVTLARERLGMTHREMANALAPLLGWNPSPEIVEGWETTATPPGDVILAVGLVSQRTGQDIVPVPLSDDA